MLTIKMEGLEDLQRRLQAIPKELDQEGRPAMHRAVVMLTEEAQSRIYSRSGRARAGLHTTESGSGASLEGRIRARGAAKRSIEGRPAGKQPKIGTVRRFMARAGQPVSRSRAFIIARAIGHRGTVGRPIMEAVQQAKRADVVRLFYEAIQRAVRGGG